MRYKFGLKEFKNGKKKPVATFVSKKYEVVGTFFTVDVAAFKEDIRESFLEVIKSENDAAEVSECYNVCGVVIKKDKTYVYDNFKEEEADEETGVYVDTLELYGALDAWCRYIDDLK